MKISLFNLILVILGVQFVLYGGVILALWRTKYLVRIKNALNPPKTDPFVSEANEANEASEAFEESFNSEEEESFNSEEESFNDTEEGFENEY